MIERYLRQSPLADLGLEGRSRGARGEAGVSVAEQPFPGIVNLRGEAGDEGLLAAFRAAFGFSLPVAANTAAGDGNLAAFWLAPGEWWVVAPGPDPEAGAKLAAQARAALGNRACAITEVGEGRACIRVSGPGARPLLQKGCPLDFHERVFKAGCCAQSHLAKTAVVIHLSGDGGEEDAIFDLYVPRSFAEYVWLWLEDAAGEFGDAGA